MKSISKTQLSRLIRKMVSENLNLAPPPEPVLSKADLVDEDAPKSDQELIARIRDLIDSYETAKNKPIESSSQADDII